MYFQETNKDAYLPRAAYSAKNEQIQTKYLQDASYIRLKNLQIGYTLPQDLTRKISIEKLRVYFSGENLAYWSPLAKHSKYIDPESAFRRKTNENNARDHMAYPWQKTMMFGIDITF